MADALDTNERPEVDTMGQRLENARSLYLEAIRDGNAEQATKRYSGQRYTPGLTAGSSDHGHQEGTHSSMKSALDVFRSGAVNLTAP